MSNKRYITSSIFLAATGREPIQDDLERSNCPKAGQFGHEYCGWCEEHNLPIFEDIINHYIPPQPPIKGIDY